MTEPGVVTQADADPAAVRRRGRILRWACVALGAWLLTAYVVLPALWRHYGSRPEMENAPKISYTPNGIPGDALNVALVGTEEQVVKAMLAAKWDPADPVTFRSSLKIAASVALGRPYHDAPVSPLFVFGRKQDLAFEKPSGKSAKRRHHVRFWKSESLGKNHVPLWVGAATFDESVGLSHTTGQITHHIAPDIDADRNLLIHDLRVVGRLTQIGQVTGVGATLTGRNGGGDLYFTDGELTVGVLAPADTPASATPEVLPNPTPVRIKEQLWAAVRPWLDAAETP